MVRKASLRIPRFRWGPKDNSERLRKSLEQQSRSGGTLLDDDDSSNSSVDSSCLSRGLSATISFQHARKEPVTVAPTRAIRRGSLQHSKSMPLEEMGRAIRRVSLSGGASCASDSSQRYLQKLRNEEREQMKARLQKPSRDPLGGSLHRMHKQFFEYDSIIDPDLADDDDSVTGW